jgi:hypothetical protein
VGIELSKKKSTPAQHRLYQKASPVGSLPVRQSVEHSPLAWIVLD